MPERVQVTTALHDGTVVTAGQIIYEATRGRLRPAVNFEYEQSYLSLPGAFSLSPDLPLGRGLIPARFDQQIFGAFADASPDQWGRRLIEAERRRDARETGQRVEPLDDLGLLLATNDTTRQGALQFPGRAPGTDIPALGMLDLPELVEAVAAFEESGDDQRLRDIVPLGSTQGGARPKVSVLDSSGQLAIAKLPRQSDRWDVEAWEAATARMAAAAGIDVPVVELHRVSEFRSVLVTRRFDRRKDGARRAYISARTFAQVTATTSDLFDYTTLASEVTAQSDHPRKQGAQLFRRVVFTLLTNNVDDHLRNHGFLRSRTGWELSPAFDVNPHPYVGSLDSMPVSSDDDPRQRSLHLLVENAAAFRVASTEVPKILSEIVSVVDRWHRYAADAGIERDAVHQMAEAFTGRARTEAETLLV